MLVLEFQGNDSRDFGFRTRKPPQKFGVESGLIQKQLKYGKKLFTWLYVARYTFIPTYTFGRIEFSFFFSFCFLSFVRSSSPKPQHIEIQFLCKFVDLLMQFCLPKFFGATPPEPPKIGPPKKIFLIAQARAIVFFLFQ